MSTPFCPNCGQENEPLQLGVREILRDTLEEFLRFDAKLYCTLKPLITKPGFLTEEWAAGRRTSYIAPTKLYLTSTFLFFFIAFNKVKNLVNVESGDEKPFVDKVYDGPPIVQFFQRGAERLDHLGPNAANDAISDHLPTALFVMLPFLAMCLNLVYYRRGKYYAEHLVFALHLHAFYFLVLTVLSVIPNGDPVGFLICVVYTIIALRRFYGQRTWKTFLKFGLLGCGYSVLLGLAIFSALFVGVSLARGQKPTPENNTVPHPTGAKEKKS